MPIIYVPDSGNFLGPGLVGHFESDFVGPFPGNPTWSIALTSDSDFTHFVMSGALSSDLHQVSVQWGMAFQGWKWGLPGLGATPEGQPIFWRAQVFGPGSTVTDTGNGSLPFDAHSGLPAFIQEKTQDAGVPEQLPVQIQQILDATPALTPVDDLGLFELTPGSPVGFLDVGLPDPIFGLIVRVSSVPPQLVPIDGDNNYWRTTLATLSVYRANDLWLRFPVHTSTRIFPFPQEGLTGLVAHTWLVSWLLNMHLTVTTFPGVTVRVFMMKTP